MTQETPEGGALPPTGANPSFAAAETEAAEAEAKAKQKVEADSPPADPNEKPVKPQKSGEQIRIDELTRRLREAERRNERLLRVAEESRREPVPDPPKPPQKRTLKDFNYDESAYADHLRQETRSEAAEAARSETHKAREQETAALRRERYEAKVTEFAKETTDFNEVVQGQWLCSVPMAEAIEDSDEGPAVAYYLAQNPEIASQMSRLSAVQAGREIAKLEHQLVSERKKALERPVTKAPPPAPKIEGADPGNIEKDPSKMTDAQFRKWREGTMARRR